MFHKREFYIYLYIYIYINMKSMMQVERVAIKRILIAVGSGIK